MDFWNFLQQIDDMSSDNPQIANQRKPTIRGKTQQIFENMLLLYVVDLS